MSGCWAHTDNQLVKSSNCRMFTMHPIRLESGAVKHLCMNTRKKAEAEKKLDDPSLNGPTQVLGLFHPVTAAWFRAVFDQPTPPQLQGWPAIARGESTLILAPTGTGKTLTAFLWCLDALMMPNATASEPGCRVVYISPLKALAVDVERNLRSPLVGIANMARRQGLPCACPRSVSNRRHFAEGTRPIPPTSRRHLITTPESLYLMLTSEAGEACAGGNGHHR